MAIERIRIKNMDGFSLIIFVDQGVKTQDLWFP